MFYAFCYWNVNMDKFGNIPGGKYKKIELNSNTQEIMDKEKKLYIDDLNYRNRYLMSWMLVGEYMTNRVIYSNSWFIAGK